MTKDEASGMERSGDRKCQRCSELIPADKRADARYCTEACRIYNANHRKQPKPRTTTICRVCSVDISHLDSRARYCSRKCFKSREYENIGYPSTCAHCGKDWIAKRKGSIYCSVGCVNTAVKKNDDVELICLWCGEKFTRSFMERDRQFCSISHRSKYTNAHRDNEAVACKISETKKKSYASGRTKHPWLGRHHTDEMKARLSALAKERVAKPDYINPMQGKRHSLETREKMSDVRTAKIVAGDYKTWAVRGRYASAKMDKEMVYRSSWELTFMHFLDACDDVVAFEVEPFRIPYDFNGQRRHYVPDLLVTYADGSKELVEIKPSCFADYDINVAKFEAASTYATENDAIFSIWTEDDLQELTGFSPFDLVQRKNVACSANL